MGFNFQGASTTSAHTHSNVSSDGGALSITATQLDNTTLYTRILVGA
jgi:hypothetical protein